MPPLKVSFTLSERDLAHLRRSLKSTRANVHARSDEEICKAASSLVDQVRGAEAPEYVLERVDVLETLSEMLRDSDWTQPSSVRGRARTALGYFLDPEDLIPDATPGLGYLDDAIIIELLTRELRHEIKAYREFRAWRDARARTHEDVVRRRKRLRVRIQDGRHRDADGRRFRLF